MEQNLIVPPQEAVFEITSLMVVVHNFGAFPIGMQYVYADLYEDVLHFKEQIQQRIGIPIAAQLWLTYLGEDMFDDKVLTQFALTPHSRIHLFIVEDWPIPLQNLLPPPPPPPADPQQQHAESYTHSYESAGSNSSVSDAVGGDAMYEDPFEVVNGGANLQVCDGCVSVITKLVNVSRSDIMYDMLDSANILSFLTRVFEKDYIRTVAKHIKETYFAVESQTSEIGLIETLQKLRKYSATLNDMVNLSMRNNIWSGLKENLFYTLGRILMELSEGESVSTFEFTECGIVKSLVNYFSNGQYLKGKLVEHHSVSDYSLVTVERFAMFASFSLSSTSLLWEGTPLAFLVRKLQTVVSSLVNFLVFQYQITNPRPTYAAIPTKYATTHPCLRFRFLKEDGEKDLCDDSLHAVIIEPFTSFDAIDRYFWPQVNARRGEAQTVSAGNIADTQNYPRKFYQNLLRLSGMLTVELPYYLEKSDPVYEILFLQILESINKSTCHLMSHERVKAFAEGKSADLDSLAVTGCPVPQSGLLSNKQIEKLEQQMVIPSSVSVGALPSWCSKRMAECPFLFSFEARNKYFLLTALLSPLIQFHSSSISSNHNSSPSSDRCSLVGNFPWRKFPFHRTLILNSAAQMMGAYAHQKVTLEVEYNEEVGSGLGPTLEFYTLVSHGCHRLGLGMWREDHSFPSSGENVESEFVVAPSGLFPRPWSATIESSEVLKRFVLPGKVVAKTFQDGRVLDLPLSKAFYKLSLNQDLNIHDIRSLDPGLGIVLLEFQALVDRMRMVNTNLEEYVSLIVDSTLNPAILRQAEALKSGFNQEFYYLVGAVVSPKTFVAIVYGSKLSSEIGVIESSLEKVDVVIISGRSPVEEDKLGLAKSLYLKARARRVQLVLPLDIRVADKFAPDGYSKRVGIYAMLEGLMGLGICMISDDINNRHLNKARTVVWYGTMGVYGMEKFAHGAQIRVSLVNDVDVALRKSMETSSSLFMEAESLKSSMLSGFQLATGAGPLCDEPLRGLKFLVEVSVIPVENHSSESDVSTQLADQCCIFTGQIMTVVKEACRAAVLQKQPRLTEAMYFCEQIGSMYGVLSKRRARVLKEEMQEGFSLFTVHVYVHRKFEKRDLELQVLYLYLVIGKSCLRILSLYLRWFYA